MVRTGLLVCFLVIRGGLASGVYGCLNPISRTQEFNLGQVTVSASSSYAACQDGMMDQRNFEAMGPMHAHLDFQPAYLDGLGGSEVEVVIPLSGFSAFGDDWGFMSMVMVTLTPNALIPVTMAKVSYAGLVEYGARLMVGMVASLGEGVSYDHQASGFYYYKRFEDVGVWSADGPLTLDPVVVGIVLSHMPSFDGNVTGYGGEIRISQSTSSQESPLSHHPEPATALITISGIGVLIWKRRRAR